MSNRLMLFGEVFAAYCQNRTKHTDYTVWAEYRILILSRVLLGNATTITWILWIQLGSLLQQLLRLHTTGITHNFAFDSTQTRIF
jgi:hypothetical protein